jgi:zinc protease
MTSRFTATIARLALAPALFAASVAWAGPTIQHWIADNGARVYFVPSQALPMLDVRIDFAAGSARQPAGLAGLASMTRSLIETGADGLDEQDIAERIADTGAQIGGGTDNDRAWMTVRTLSSADERDAALSLAARLLSRPDYPEAALVRERSRAIAGLRESLTRPATLAGRRFDELVFGDHPYGRNATEQSLELITRDVVVDFHHRHYSAANAAVTIVGDATREEAEHIAEALTRDLPVGDALGPIEPPAMPAASVERIAHPSAQAHILAGMPGIAREDPDYYTLLVGNHVLGGSGLVSRLSREVRDERGFAYSVYSYFAPDQVRGVFQIGLQTRGSQADDALEVVREVLDDFIENGPTEDELAAAKSNIINGFGLRLDSNSKILGYVAMIGFYGLPLDWLDTYTKHVEAVDAQGIREAFARRIRPENLAVVIAGGDGDRGQQP